MADETTPASGASQATTDNSQQQAATTTATTQAAATTGDATGQDKQTAGQAAAATFTQADVDRIVTERLQRAQTKAQADAAKATADAEAKVLAEQGKFKELYEKAQADQQAAQARIQQMELNALRSTIGRRLALPDALHARLQGDDEASIEADAKALLAALPKPTAPNINSAGGGQPVTETAATAAAAQELAAIYGVNARFWPTQTQ